MLKEDQVNVKGGSTKCERGDPVVTYTSLQVYYKTTLKAIIKSIGFILISRY